MRGLPPIALLLLILLLDGEGLVLSPRVADPFPSKTSPLSPLQHECVSPSGRTLAHLQAPPLLSLQDAEMESKNDTGVKARPGRVGRKPGSKVKREVISVFPLFYRLSVCV